MNAIYGLFADESSALRALISLRAACPRLRLEPKEIVIISCEPLEGEGFGMENEHSYMPWLAPLGAILGAGVGYALSAFTQRTYPLPTGGMPIVAMWPTGIIMYELTMLGAVITTIIAFIVSTGLPNFRRRLYDPEVTNGKILIGISRCREEFRAVLEKLFYEGGAEQVKLFSDH